MQLLGSFLVLASALASAGNPETAESTVVAEGVSDSPKEDASTIAAASELLFRSAAVFAEGVQAALAAGSIPFTTIGNAMLDPIAVAKNIYNPLFDRVAPFLPPRNLADFDGTAYQSRPYRANYETAYDPVTDLYADHAAVLRNLVTDKLPAVSNGRESFDDESVNERHEGYSEVRNRHRSRLRRLYNQPFYAMPVEYYEPPWYLPGGPISSDDDVMMLLPM